MKQSITSIWSEQFPRQLVEALLTTNSKVTLQNFLGDVMTEKEIREISARFEAARLLDQKTSYAQIASITKLSSRTIARISDWMKNGNGGYRVVLSHHKHDEPTHVE